MENKTSEMVACLPVAVGNMVGDIYLDMDFGMKLNVGDVLMPIDELGNPAPWVKSINIDSDHMYAFLKFHCKITEKFYEGRGLMIWNDSLF